MKNTIVLVYSILIAAIGGAVLLTVVDLLTDWADASTEAIIAPQSPLRIDLHNEMQINNVCNTDKACETIINQANEV